MERPLLHRMPAKDAARELALRLTQKAAEACVRLHRPQDVEALHDFRVGIRRLRTFLGAYGTALDLGPKTLKRLKRLARSTNATRDLEVGIEWLRRQRERLDSRQRVGLNWLLEKLVAEKDEAYEQVRGRLPVRWARLEAKLRRRMSFPVTGELAIGTFGQVSSGLILESASRLEQRLAEIGSVDDAGPAHEARIRAKRLRYLLEPFRGTMPRTKPVLRDLRRLQDTFGEMNDAHVMLPRLRQAARLAAAERAQRLFDLALDERADPREVRAARRRSEQSGLHRLARLAREEQRELFARIAERYLEGRAAELLAAVRGVAETLAAVEPPQRLRLVQAPRGGSAEREPD